MRAEIKKIVTELIVGVIVWLFLWIMYCQIQPYILTISDFAFSNLPTNETSHNRSFLVVIIFALTGYHSITELWKRKLPSSKSIVICTVTGLLYFNLFRIDPEFNFFLLTENPKIYLCDVLLISCFFAFSNYSFFSEKPVKAKRGIIQEVSDLALDEDSLFRQKQVEELIRLIERTSPEHSISISITAEWGNGKSVFLNFLEKKLNKSSLIIKFNPWIARHNKSTIGVFFDLLKEELSKYDARTADKIHNYSSNILLVQSEDGFILKMLKTLIGFLIPNPNTLAEQKVEINKSISRIGKRIIVFVDDLDRVSPEEILEVMNLIKNTADFRNTIFLVAMDLGYIKSALKSSNSLLDVDKYLEKIFQLQFVLAPIMFETIKLMLVTELERFLANNADLEFSNEFSENFTNAIANISYKPDIVNGEVGLSSFNEPGVLEATLTNVRDIKRFLNSFILSYRLIGEELEMMDLILLELLKLKFTSFYLELARGKYIRISSVNHGKWQIDPDQVENIEKNQYPTLLKKLFESLYLIPENFEPNSNSITFISNHKKYFNFDLSGDMSYASFKQIINIGELHQYFVIHICKLDYNESNVVVKQKIRVTKFFDFLLNLELSDERSEKIIQSLGYINYLKKPFFPIVLRSYIRKHFANNDPLQNEIENLFINPEIYLAFKNELYTIIIKHLNNDEVKSYVKMSTISFFTLESNKFNKENFGEVVMLMARYQRDYASIPIGLKEDSLYLMKFLEFFKKYPELFFKALFVRTDYRNHLRFNEYFMDFSLFVIQKYSDRTPSFVYLLREYFPSFKISQHLINYFEKDDINSYSDFKMDVETLNELLNKDHLGDYNDLLPDGSFL